MDGHSHFQTSSTFPAKVGKMAEAQLVASVFLQELLEELAPPPGGGTRKNFDGSVPLGL